MSGDAIGILIGGALLLGAIPVVVGGVLAAGAAVATFQVGKGLFHVGERALEARGRRKALEAQQCSEELRQMYKRLEETLKEQEKQYGGVAQRMGRELEASSEALKSMMQEEKRDAAWVQKVNQMRQQVMAEMNRTSAEERQRIHRETKTALAEIGSEMEQERRTQQDLVQWKSSRAEDRAQQKALCAKLLRDAQATLKLCRSLGGMAPEADALGKSLTKAQQHFDQGSYQACLAESQDVITTGARLAAEISQRTLELDAVREEILAKCEGLKAYLENCRRITFVDEFFQEEVTEDLNNFSQGRYAQVQEEIDDLIGRLEREDWTEAELTLLEEEIGSVLTPKVETVCEAARDHLLAYYERLHTMEKLADYMRSQNYKLDWACHPGDDQTQKLTVRFVNSTTGNSVVLTLDRDMTTEDIHRMLMDLHVFYQNGKPMTEAEKQALRAGMTKALAGTDVQATLSCAGRVNQPSAQTQLEKEENTRSAVPVQRI